MKLFNAIAAATIVRTSLITVAFAEARNGWNFAAKGENSHYVKKLGSQGPFVKFQWKATGNGGWDHISFADVMDGRQGSLKTLHGMKLCQEQWQTVY